MADFFYTLSVIYLKKIKVCQALLYFCLEKKLEMSELFLTTSDKLPNVKILNNNPVGVPWPKSRISREFGHI